MADPTHDSNTVDSSSASGSSAGRRKSIIRSVIILAIATAVLILFIVLLGDLRRRSFAMSQAKWCQAQLQTRLGENRVLPLNLELDVSPAASSKTLHFESLAREQAWLLRESDQRIMVAQTAPIRRRLLPDGRAVVFFEEGRFGFEWLRDRDFDRLCGAQGEELRRLASDAPGDPADVP